MQNKLYFVVIPVIFTALIYLLDFNTTILGISSMSDEFDLNLRLTSWIILSSSIIMTAFLLPIGNLADLLNRKFFYIISLIIYLFGLLLSSFSSNVYMLILFKTISAIGSTGSSILMFVVITSTFPKKYQGLGLSIITTAVASGQMIGPLFAGFLLENYGWRFAYQLIFGMGLFTLLMVIMFVPKLDRPKLEVKHIDTFGIFYSLMFMTLFVFIINDPFNLGFYSLGNMLQIIIFIIFIYLFYKREKKFNNPILILKNFSNPLYLWGTISRILGFTGFSILIFLNPIFLQKVVGISESSSGLILFYSGTGTVIASSISGRLSDKFGHRIFMIIGMLCSAFANIILSFLANDFNFIFFTLLMFINGFGIGLWMAPNMSAVLKSVSENQYGSVSAYLNLIRNIGTTIGQSLAATILVIFLSSGITDVQLSDINSNSPDEILQLFRNGWRLTLIISSIIIFISVLASYKTKQEEKNEYFK